MSRARNLPVVARLAIMAALAALLQGCSTTPRFNSHFGESVRANLAAQVLDPDASANTDPVTGIDGVTARANHERYQRSFGTAAAAKPLVAGGSGDR